MGCPLPRRRRWPGGAAPGPSRARARRWPSRTRRALQCLLGGPGLGLRRVEGLPRDDLLLRPAPGGARARSGRGRRAASARSCSARARPRAARAAATAASGLGPGPGVEEHRRRRAGRWPARSRPPDRVAGLEVDAQHAPGHRRGDDEAVAHARLALLVDGHQQRRPARRWRGPRAPTAGHRAMTQEEEPRSPATARTLRLRRCRSGFIASTPGS